SVATTIATQPQNENLTSLTWLLAHQKWSVASEVTWQILAPAAPDHTLQTEHCNLILEIDRLWTHYSGGRYGFEAQERVWDSLASGQSATQPTTQPATRNRSIGDRIQQFRQRVGWTANRASATATPKPIGAFPAEAPWPTDPHQPLLCGDRACTPSPTAIAAAYPSLGIIQMFDRCLEQSPQF
ncbi:MAG TPA: GUN4 domain-containing protein, partial [Coleofasciculaceae cyanobacterium]